MSLNSDTALRQCDTGEINCITCIGRENCTQYATVAVGLNEAEYREHNLDTHYILDEYDEPMYVERVQRGIMVRKCETGVVKCLVCLGDECTKIVELNKDIVDDEI